MRDSPSVHSQHSLNARLLRFRSQPHSEDAYALVEDLIDAGRHADARSVIGLAKPQDREDAALLLLEGRAHLLERDLIRAQAALLAAVKAEPNLQPAYRYLGEVLLKRGDPLRARKTLRRALALAAEDEEARELLERAEYLVEAANDSLEALPVARDSEFDVDAQAELQAAEFVDQLPSEPASALDRTDIEHATSAGRRKPQDEPTSQFRFGRSRTSEAPPEPASSHRQKTQADHVPPASPPRQRPRRQEELAVAEQVEPAASPRQRAGSAGAFQPPLPAARAQMPAETAYDSEPAAPHAQARAGTEPKRPHARRDDHAPEPLAQARDRPPEAARVASPRGAWTAQDALTGDSEPALPHSAARAGVDPAPDVRASLPKPQRSAPAVDADEDDDYPAWHEEPRAGAPRDVVAAARAGSPRTAAASDDPAGSADREGAAARVRSEGDSAPGSPDAARSGVDAAAAASESDFGRSSVPAKPRAVPPAPPRRAAAGGPGARRASVPDGRDSASASAAPRRAAAAGDDPGSLGRSSAPASAADSRQPDSARADAGAATSSAPAEEASWGGPELEKAATAALAATPGRRSGEAIKASIRPGKRLSDFRMQPGPAAPDAQPDEAAPLAAADGGDESDPEQVLQLVRQLGMFEDPTGQPEAWVERREVEPRGQRVRGALVWLWGVSLLLCVGGYFGWNEFVTRRHAAAASFVSEARLLMSQGDHAALVDAERLLRLAREQHPASVTVSEEALFVQLQRVLEDGERDTAALRTAYARAHASHVTGPGMALANLLLSAAVSDIAGRDRALNEVFAMAKGDARTLYLVGRAEERMGSDAAQAHLEAAASADAKLIPAQLALAERAYERGERAAATRMLDTAVAQAPNQLRVRLFRMLVVADDAEPDKLRQDLNGLATPLRKGNSIDRALAALVRARLARRGGEHTAALKAIDAAAESGVEDARVLSWLAEEALAIGNSQLAQQLASHALQLAPERMRSRRLLARILVERGAGQQAFVLLSSLPPTDVEVQVLKARAALLSNDPELLRNALAGLPTAWPKKSDVDVQRAALRLRIETQLDPTKAVLDRAQRLVHAAPTDPDALLALAESALAMRDAKLAQNALKQRALLIPDDVQAQTLLGRSLRMGGDIDGAEAAFRHALSLRAGYVEAQTGLASLLLDRGQYSQADEVYRELAVRDETALSGRLGRVEALLGQGKLADAQVQLEAAPEAERATAAYREVFAKLALARGEVGQAIKLLDGLSAELPKRAGLRALHAEALLTAAQISPADSEIDAALALDPGLPEALLGRAELQLRANKTKDALTTLDKAEDALRGRLRPPAVGARRLILLGRTLTQRKKRGDAENAVRTLRQVTAQPAAPAEAYYFLGEALTLAKDKAAAVEAYRRYIELAPSGVYRQRAQRMLAAR